MRSTLVLHGPGKNNEIVVALARLESLSGGENSVINNPDQLLGGKNSLFHSPGGVLGGENSVANQILTKPFGGDHSVPNVVTKGGERIVQETGKALEKGAQAVGHGVEKGAQDVGKGVEHLGQEGEKILKKLSPF